MNNTSNRIPYSFVWNDIYSTSINLIDEQHKRFFELLNKVQLLLANDSASFEDVMSIAKEMNDYAFFHFSVEEKYFIEFNYKYLDKHVEAHNVFRGVVSDMMKKIEDPNADFRDIIYNLSIFGKEWFLNHIIAEDIKYAECFIEHGVS